MTVIGTVKLFPDGLTCPPLPIVHWLFDSVPLPNVTGPIHPLPASLAKYMALLARAYWIQQAPAAFKLELKSAYTLDKYEAPAEDE